MTWLAGFKGFSTLVIERLPDGLQLFSAQRNYGHHTTYWSTIRVMASLGADEEPTSLYFDGIVRPDDVEGID